MIKACFTLSYFCNHTVSVTQEEQIQSLLLICWVLKWQVLEMDVLVWILHDHYFSGEEKNRLRKFQGNKWTQNLNSPTLNTDTIMKNKLTQLCYPLPSCCLGLAQLYIQTNTSASQCGLQPSLSHALYLSRGLKLDSRRGLLLIGSSTHQELWNTAWMIPMIRPYHLNYATRVVTVWLLDRDIKECNMSEEHM